MEPIQKGKQTNKTNNMCTSDKGKQTNKQAEAACVEAQMQGAVQSCITCRVQYAMHQSTRKSFGDALEMCWKSVEFDTQGCTLTPSPKRMRVIPPPHYPGTLPPTLHSSKAGCQGSINLKDYGINTHIPAQKQHEHHRVYACGSCGSNGSHILVDASSNKDVPKEIWQAEVILAALHEQNLMIGQFLVVILDPKNEDRLTQNSQSVLAAFLQGWTVVGTQPINATRLMFHHHLSQDGPRDANTAYHLLPIYAWPPTIPSSHPQSISSSSDSMSDVTSTPGFDTRSILNGVRAHCSLKQYFLCEVLEEINSEIKTLVKESTLYAEGSVALSWSKTMSFSFMQTQELIQKKALALWSVLTMAAIGNGNIGRLLSIWKKANKGPKWCGSNNI